MVRPSEVDDRLSFFDRLADRVGAFTARAIFFAMCVAVVLLWAPSYFVIRDLDVWQLIINTFTTIVTFLLVALLQNTSTRADRASQRKLNAVLALLADPDDEESRAEARAAIGLEGRESS